MYVGKTVWLISPQEVTQSLHVPYVTDCECVGTYMYQAAAMYPHNTVPRIVPVAVKVSILIG